MSTPRADTSLAAALADVSLARPDAPAITCAGVTTTFADLDRRAELRAHELRDLGRLAGSFVTIALPNGAAFLETVVACWKLGAVPQPVSAGLPLPELQAVVGLAESAVVVGLDPGDGRPWLPAGWQPAARPRPRLPDAVSPSWKAPTSGGSTGRPKLVVAGTPGLLGPVTARAALLGIRPGSTHLCSGPLHHNAPFTFACLALLLGGHVVVMPRFDAAEALALVAEHRVTWMYAVPTMLSRVLRLPDAQREAADLSSVEVVLSTAAACPSRVKRAWCEWIGAERVWELYGGTEGVAACLVRGDAWLERPGTVGRAVYGSVEVRDPQGRPCPPGQVGEVWLRPEPGPYPPYRYVGAHARTSPDGWESLGDLGHLDDEGHLYLGGRSTDMVLVGGANVYPAEVESALLEHPAVDSAVVVGLPDDDLGARLHALVHLAVEVGDDELHRHLRSRLVAYKCPRTFERLQRPVRDEADKVRRSRLIAERS